MRTQTSVNQPDCSGSVPPERMKRPVTSADCSESARILTLSMRSLCLGLPSTKYVPAKEASMASIVGRGPFLVMTVTDGS